MCRPQFANLETIIALAPGSSGSSNAFLFVPPPWESLAESDVPVNWGSTGRKLCGPTRSFWMLFACFAIRSLDIWHRRKIARFLPVFATFPLECFFWRTTRRQTWVPSTSAILSEANLLEQRVCLSEKSRMLYLARWFVDSKSLVPGFQRNLI